MTRDIITNKWFIGAIALLIIIAGACYLWYQHDTAPYRQEAAESAKLLRQQEAAKKVDNKSEGEQGIDASVESKTPAAGKLTSDENPENTLTPSDFHKLSEKQQQQIFDSFYTQHGLKVPPRGYTYRWKSPGVPLLDENGKPILHKRGEPIVEIKMGIGFTPTLEEYEMLRALKIEAGWQKAQGNTAKAEQLWAEWGQLYEEVQRERPVKGSTLWVAPKKEKEADPDKPLRIMKEKLRAALIEHGYSYLIPILEEKGEL